MSAFQERKAERMAHFETYVKGWKMRPCTACNGSGYFDHNGSPKCSACEGTGKERYKPAPINQEGVTTCEAVQSSRKQR